MTAERHTSADSSLSIWRWWVIAGGLIVLQAPVAATVALAVLFELAMALHIRDNLTLNIIMLIHPFAAIRLWQSGPPII